MDPPSGPASTAGSTLQKSGRESKRQSVPSASPGRGEAARPRGVYLAVRLLGDELSESQLLHGGVGQNGRIWRLAAAFNHRRLEGSQKPAGKTVTLVCITMFFKVKKKKFMSEKPLSLTMCTETG